MISWIGRITSWISRITVWISRITDWISRITDWISRVTDWISRITDWVCPITCTQNASVEVSLTCLICFWSESAGDNSGMRSGGKEREGVINVPKGIG